MFSDFSISVPCVILRGGGVLVGMVLWAVCVHAIYRLEGMTLE